MISTEPSGPLGKRTSSGTVRNYYIFLVSLFTFILFMNFIPLWIAGKVSRFLALKRLLWLGVWQRTRLFFFGYSELENHVHERSAKCSSRPRRISLSTRKCSLYFGLDFKLARILTQSTVAVTHESLRFYYPTTYFYNKSVVKIWTLGKDKRSSFAIRHSWWLVSKLVIWNAEQLYSPRGPHLNGFRLLQVIIVL